MKVLILVCLFIIKCSYALYRASDRIGSVNRGVNEKHQCIDNELKDAIDREIKIIARNKNQDKFTHLRYNRKHVLASEIRKRSHANKQDRDKQTQRPKTNKKQISSNDIRKRSPKHSTTKKPAKAPTSDIKNYMTPSDFKIKYDRFIFPCYTTDMECFRRQYRSIRDNALLGNAKLGIPPYEDFVFRYSESTCVRLSGWEESELAMISVDSRSKNLNLAFDLPIRIRQVKGTVKPCKSPDKQFDTKMIKNGPLRRFTGNATVIVSYPFNLKRTNSNTYYMYLEDEDIDVTFDIPDWSHMKGKKGVEAKLYEWSEWAYDMVQHVDAAQNFVMPYTNQLRTLLHKIPISRFVMLYPDEVYMKLKFTLEKENFVNKLSSIDGEMIMLR